MTQLFPLSLLNARKRVKTDGVTHARASFASSVSMAAFWSKLSIFGQSSEQLKVSGVKFRKAGIDCICSSFTLYVESGEGGGRLNKTVL